VKGEKGVGLPGKDGEPGKNRDVLFGGEKDKGLEGQREIPGGRRGTGI